MQSSVQAQRLTEEPIIHPGLDAYYSFDLNYSYTMDLNDSALIISLGAIDLFEADLPRLKNANGTDLSTFDIRGRRVYGSVKFIL